MQFCKDEFQPKSESEWISVEEIEDILLPMIQSANDSAIMFEKDGSHFSSVSSQAMAQAYSIALNKIKEAIKAPSIKTPKI